MSNNEIKTIASSMPGCPAWTVAVFKAEDVPEGTEVFPAAPVQAQHSDDAAIDRFAATMKAKMAASRAKGRSGWDDPAQCPVEKLAAMLCQHVEKGDPVDIANFAMMIHERQGSAIDVYEALAVFLNSHSITTPVQAQEPVAETYAHTMSNGRGRPDDPAPFETVCVRLLRNDLPADLKLYAAPAQPVAVPDGEEFGFKAVRLRRTAFLLGLEGAIPDNDKDLMDCMGAVLGMICREVERLAVPAAQVDAKDEVYEFAAKVIELFDDATMRVGYMLDAGECASIIRALKSTEMAAIAAKAAS